LSTTGQRKKRQYDLAKKRRLLLQLEDAGSGEEAGGAMVLSFVGYVRDDNRSSFPS
jgi:hypothetical protein